MRSVTMRTVAKKAAITPMAKRFVSRGSSSSYRKVRRVVSIKRIEVKMVQKTKAAKEKLTALVVADDMGFLQFK